MAGWGGACIVRRKRANGGEFAKATSAAVVLIARIIALKRDFLVAPQVYPVDRGVTALRPTAIQASCSLDDQNALACRGAILIVVACANDRRDRRL
jgi:hypothetical protein